MSGAWRSAEGCGDPFRGAPFDYGECCQRNLTDSFFAAFAPEPWVGGVYVGGYDPFAPHPAAQVPDYSAQDTAAYDSLAKRYFARPPRDPSDDDLFNFERTAQRFVAQNTPGIRGIFGVFPMQTQAFAGNGSLEVSCKLDGANPDFRRGEALVDLSRMGFGPSHDSYQSQPLDLTGQVLTGAAFMPTGAAGVLGNPNAIHLFVRDSSSRSLFGTRQDIQEGLWMALSMTISNVAPPGGSMSPGFQPDQVTLVGVKMGIGTGSTETYMGTIYVDAVQISGMPSWL